MIPYPEKSEALKRACFVVLLCGIIRTDKGTEYRQ